MPDSGSNGYISVAPDGTVVTPTNLTPAGVIAAGDLATHADLDTLVSDYDLPDVAHLADIPDVSSFVVGDGVAEVSGGFALPLTQAATFDTFFYADYDFGPSGPRSWATYAFVGYFVGQGALTLSTVEHINATTTRFWFCSLSNTLQNIDGTFYFYAIGHP